MPVRILVLLAAVMLVAGCSGSKAFNKGEGYAVEGDWDRSIAEYRKAYQSDPEDISYKTRLTKALDMAATAHVERANYYLKDGNADAALYEAQQALVYVPGHDKAQQLVNAANRLKEIDSRMAVGQNYLSAGRPNEALKEFFRVLEMDPKHPRATAYIESITKQKAAIEKAGELTLGSDEPITLSFKDAKLKEVFEFLSKLSGISIVFDEDVKNTPVTVFAKDVSFQQALTLLLNTNKLFMKKIASDAIIIVPKTKSKMDQYQDLMIKTFYLSSVQAKDMVNIIRTMLETRKVIINETLNSITLRETPDKIKLIEKLIEANDKKDAEVVIDVEILAVDKGTTTTFGVSLPKGVTGTYIPPGGITAAPAAAATSVPATVITTAGLMMNSGTGAAKNNIFFSYPSVTVDWSKAKAEAEVLTNPQIRTLNNTQAKILIGKRVPVNVGTTVASGGVTTTTTEYRDIGIKLTVTPNVGLDNSVTMKTTLEVSDFGAAPSGVVVSQPIFTTTNAEATLTLKDGETVIIGGLYSHRKTVDVKGILGLIDVPILGKLLSTTTIDPNSKSELIMTLTPHVVRSKEIPDYDVSAFWSGTEESYETKPLFEEKKSIEVEEPPVDITEYTGPQPAATATGPVRVTPTEPAVPQPSDITPAATPAPQPAPQPQPEAAPATTTPAPEAAAPGGGETPPAETPQPATAVPAVVTPVVTPPATKTAPPPIKPPPTELNAVPTGRVGRVGTLGFAPEVSPLEVGQEITLDVTVADMDSVFEAPLSIIYNPKLVEFMKATEGDFMKVDGKPTSFMVSVNDKLGFIDVFVTRLGKVTGVSGSGRLFSLTFKGRAPGIGPLVFKQNTLKDATGAPVQADLKTGTLYVK